jgi:hypothetical protein
LGLRNARALTLSSFAAIGRRPKPENMRRLSVYTEDPTQEARPMIYPPDIQRRLAEMHRLSHPEQDALHCDMVTFVKEQMQLHGGTVPDVYPQLYPPTPGEFEEMRNAFLRNRPLLRLMLNCQRTLTKWVNRVRPADAAQVARSTWSN